MIRKNVYTEKVKLEAWVKMRVCEDVWCEG